MTDRPGGLKTLHHDLVARGHENRAERDEVLLLQSEKVVRPAPQERDAVQASCGGGAAGRGYGLGDRGAA